MKLNADMIYHALRENLDVGLSGRSGEALALLRPEFYLDKAETFVKDHVYVCSADHLPSSPVIGDNVVLVCLGDSPQLAVFREQCSIISVPAEEDIFQVFNIVQKVFNKYDTWVERLNSILRRSASLQEMLEASRDVFENPMLLIGSDFHYLAYTDESYLREKLGFRLEDSTFDADKMALFLSLHDLSTHVKEPLDLDLMNEHTLNVNIFDVDEYLGCITIFEEYRSFHSSDTALCVYFSRMLKQAIQSNPVLASERSAICRAVRDIIAGQPLDFEHRRIVNLWNEDRSYVCACLKPLATPFPTGYISSLLEQQFPNALAFEYEEKVVAILPAQSDKDVGSYRESLGASLEPLLQKMRLKCGISRSFSNLYESNYAYFQASAGLENGLMYRGEASLFLFEDYILQQLLRSAVGEIPARFFYSDGLAHLQQHDESSQVSYLETLRIYLDNNMSIAKTAEDLYIHRSSLLDRLARIQQILGTDLSVPELRLSIHLVLKAEELGTEAERAQRSGVSPADG